MLNLLWMREAKLLRETVIEIKTKVGWYREIHSYIGLFLLIEGFYV